MLGNVAGVTLRCLKAFNQFLLFVFVLSLDYVHSIRDVCHCSRVLESRSAHENLKSPQEAPRMSFDGGFDTS